jgi:hypothetical protein
MKTRMALIGLAVIPLLPAADEPGSPLRLFTSTKGNFSVLLPGTPREEKVSIPDPKGEPGEQYQFTLDRGNGAYVVSYQDNPDLKSAGREESERKLSAARGAVQRGFGGRLLSERKIKLHDTYPGLEFAVEVPAGPGLCRARMYLVRGRLHQVIVVGAREFAAATEADRVLDSFRLFQR